MSEVPTRDQLVEVGARAAWNDAGSHGDERPHWDDLAGFIGATEAHAAHETFRSQARAILDAVLPLVTGAARPRGIDDMTRLAIVCGNADWDGEKVCPTCGGKGYVDE